MRDGLITVASIIICTFFIELGTSTTNDCVSTIVLTDIININLMQKTIDSQPCII